MTKEVVKRARPPASPLPPSSARPTTFSCWPPSGRWLSWAPSRWVGAGSDLGAHLGGRSAHIPWAPVRPQALAQTGGGSRPKWVGAQCYARDTQFHKPWRLVLAGVGDALVLMRPRGCRHSRDGLMSCRILRCRGSGDRFVHLTARC